MRTCWKLIAFGALVTGAFGQAAPEWITPPQPPLPATLSPATKAVLQPLLSMPPSPVLSVDQKRAFAKNYQDTFSKQQMQQYDVTVTESTIAGVPVRIFTPKAMTKATAGCVLLNVHGGGFEVDSGSLTENIPIAALAKMKVVSVLYRLAPENAFPAAVDDTIAVYRELLKSHKPGRIGLYGTSAGAVLSAETIVRLRQDKLPLPAAVGFFSGSADMSTNGDSEQYLPGLDGKNVTGLLGAYVGKTDLKSPLLSPLYADLKDFPPTLCMTSTRDVLLSQTAIFHRALIRSGIKADLVVFEALPHAFWAWLPVKESREANEIQAAYFVEHLAQ